jgi:hypothetical protein
LCVKKKLECLDAVEGVKEESDGKDVEHLGATDLPSCVIHRVLTGTRKRSKVILTGGTPTFFILVWSMVVAH